MNKMDKKINRLRFCVSVRRDMIDGSERAIEHHKSMIKNYKSQIKELNREIARHVNVETLSAGVSRMAQIGTTGTVAIA